MPESISHKFARGMAAVTIAAGLASGLASTASADTLKEFDARAAALVEKAKPEQVAHVPPTGPKGVAKKKIVIIPCAMAAEGCARMARGAEEAGKLLGWDATIIDPAGDLAKVADAVQRAISIGADGLVILSNDARVLQGPLRQAKSNGMFVVAEGVNMDGLYDATLPGEKFFLDQGYLMAATAYTMGQSRLDMIKLSSPEFGAPRLREQGTQKFIDECKALGGKCSVLVSENTLVSDISTLVPKQAVSLIQKYPSYNVLWSGYDAQLNFIIQAIEQADLLKTGFSVGFDANSANTPFIAQDKYEKGTVGFPLEWVGYGLVDDLNRLFAGEKIVLDQGIRSRLIVKENIKDALKGGPAWEGDADFRAEYKALWGR
ncbi:sugar ABC transporter substrate-binding protein [Agrobacterium larrymoorei]|uniref:Substrate-binding domain-containing protein n=1 Tax=Agrobacterium larrymoorei TaxID=160699 RepID=A0AAF0HAP7_9HYPH|nr:substrate-binding domain-containing protein [Agrobacterium larrymoorei]WHA42608.1 substrate-binding domain-containing protein [Agrobacterium larrymoorei]